MRTDLSTRSPPHNTSFRYATDPTGSTRRAIDPHEDDRLDERAFVALVRGAVLRSREAATQSKARRR